MLDGAIVNHEISFCRERVREHSRGGHGVVSYCCNRGRGAYRFKYAVSRQSKEAPGWTDDAWISSSSSSAGWIDHHGSRFQKLRSRAGARSFRQLLSILRDQSIVRRGPGPLDPENTSCAGKRYGSKVGILRLWAPTVTTPFGTGVSSSLRTHESKKCRRRGRDRRRWPTSVVPARNAAASRR